MVKMNKIYSWLLATTILLAPINLFFRWAENQAYLNGLFVDYLIPKVWLAELPIILVLFIWLTELLKNKQLNIFKNKLFFLFLLIFFLRQFFTANSLISLINFFRIIELVSLGFFLKINFNNLNKKLIYLAVLASFFSQLLLANFQFFKQSNLFSYRFLGETTLTNSINIARTQFKTGLTINPYGSTAHPNILAGFLAVYTIILLSKLELKKTNHLYFGWLLILLVSWTIFLTQAYSAVIALAIYLTIKTFPQLKNKLSLALFLALTIAGPILLLYLDKYFSDLSLKRRIFLNYQGLKIWLENLVVGTGLNSFLYSLKSSYSSETVRFIQPVHHTLLLWLVETGLIGLGLLTMLKTWLMKEKTLILLFTLLPIITLDHYLLTQWLGSWLILVMVSLTE